LSSEGEKWLEELLSYRFIFGSELKALISTAVSKFDYMAVHTPQGMALFPRGLDYDQHLEEHVARLERRLAEQEANRKRRLAEQEAATPEKDKS
jgi:hypothetical protein